MRTIEYIAHPTAQAFHKSKKFIRCFKGPVGNGKSVTCIQELVRLATKQHPNSDGKRLSRALITRNTSIELRTTTLQTWMDWFPPQVCKIIYSPWLRGEMSLPLADGTTVELEVWFLALDKDDDVKKLRSLECTFAFMNEAKEQPYAVLKGLRERVGRYPAVVNGYKDIYDSGKLVYDAPKRRDKNGNPVLNSKGDPIYEPVRRKAVICDTNPPDDGHWWYELDINGHLSGIEEHRIEDAIQETRDIFNFFNGPGGLIEKDGQYLPNPNAENIEYLPGGYQYYLDMLAGNTDDHIKVMVLGQYGTITTGKPVYPGYNDRLHCSEKAFGPIRGLPILLGWDFGLTPACIVAQLTSLGQLRVIAELVTDDMNVYKFARDVVKPFLADNFHDCHIGFSVGDPTGNNRGEGVGKSAIGILNDDYCYDDGITIEPLNMGFTTRAAPTNDPTKRINAVSSFISKLIGGGEPGYLLSPYCKVLRRGKLGAYHYRKKRVSGPAQYEEKPNKADPSSHPSDAEQYIASACIAGYIMDSSEDDDYYRQPRRSRGIGGY